MTDLFWILKIPKVWKTLWMPIFFVNWHKPTDPKYTSAAKSHTGSMIMYSGCTFIQASQLQTYILLSTTESEYMELLQSLLDLIPVMLPSQETKINGVKII